MKKRKRLKENHHNVIITIFSTILFKSLDKVFLSRVLLFITIITLMIPSSLITDIPQVRGQNGRQAMAETQKVELIVDFLKLDLVWNGDQGEEGRGRGEVFVSMWVLWPTLTEEKDKDLQHKEVGPLGGDAEFLSGTIVEDPPNSGKFRIVPASAPIIDGKFRFRADCPTSKELVIDVLVWEEDSNKELKDFIDKIKDIINDRIKISETTPIPTELITTVITTLIESLTESGDDSLGRTTTKRIQIPDPCPDGFGTFKTELELENLATTLWKDVDAEAEDGTPFSDKGIEPPDNSGSIELQVTALKLENRTSSKAEKDDPPSFKELTIVNLGRPEEEVIAGQLYLGAPIPLDEPLSLKYNFYLDIDNDLSTGTEDFPAQGAEFIMQLEFDNSDTPTARLLKFDSESRHFEEVSEGLHESAISIDRSMVYLSVKLSVLGDQVTHIAGWGAIEDETGIVDMLPNNPHIIAPVITIKGVRALIFPNPVPLNGKVDIEISKNNINRNETVLVTQITLIKPLGEELSYTSLPIDISNGPVTISLPDNNWIGDNPKIDQIGRWSLIVVVATISGNTDNKFILQQYMEESFYTSFKGIPESIIGAVSVIGSSLAVLAVYRRKKANN